MNDMDATLPEARSPGHLFRGQLLHLVLLLLLTCVAYALAGPAWTEAGGTRRDLVFLGLHARTWFWITVAVVVVMHVLVWLAWRTQLGWGTLTRIFGRRDIAVWSGVFLPFLVARPLLTLAAALADPFSLLLPRWLSLSLGVIVLFPALYAVFSVARYFGIPRAVGGDHFRRAYREMPRVCQGAFAWTGNAMYALVFLLLWSIALLGGSHTALVLALWQHAYIWVHYHCTEKPDMALMYGASRA
ncbi:MAG: methyltransferase [Planctomycetota bacterium]|jgi:hypothetical protein